jgi:hypothetical protein
MRILEFQDLLESSVPDPGKSLQRQKHIFPARKGSISDISCMILEWIRGSLMNMFNSEYSS